MMAMGPMTFERGDRPAIWFDGQTSRRREVRVRLDGNSLELLASGDAVEFRRYAATALRLGERSRTGPLAVGLPDGGSLWLATPARDLAAALLAASAQRQWVARATASWPAVAACLLALVALLVWFDRQGARLAAEALIGVTPRAIDEAVGRAALKTIEPRWLRPSKLPESRRAEVARRFDEVARLAAPGINVRLQFHRTSDRGSGAGFNAFALPDGTLIVLDGLADALSDDELLAVLGHELGHVVHRHGMKAVARGVGLLTVASMVFGDFSTIAATTVGSIQTLSHSRDAEREADGYARTFATAAALPAGTLAGVWRKFRAYEKRSGGGGLPGWLSTHPSTEERLREAGQR